MTSIKILDAASVTTFVETFQNAGGTTLMASVPINSAGTALGGLVDAGDALPVFNVGGTATISGALPAGTNALGTVSALQSGAWTVTNAGGTATISGALPAGTNAIGTVSALQSGVWITVLAGGTATISGALPAGTNAVGTVSALQSGAWTATLTGGTTTISGALPAGTNALGTVSALQSGAWVFTGTTVVSGTVSISNALTATFPVATSAAVVSSSGAVAAVAVKAAAGTVFGLNLFCTNTANAVFLRLYNATTGAVNGTSVPNLILGIPSGGVNNAVLPIGGVGFGSAISYQITKLGVANDTTAVNASDLVGWITYT